MNTRTTAIIAIAGIVVLALVLLARMRSSTPASLPDSPTPAAPQITPVPSRPKRTSEVVATETPTFHWSQVESADFKQYIANLRAIGCPDETIRDIIVAEVKKLFAPRFAALAAQTGKFDYWKPGSKPGREALRQQLEALQQEKKLLLLDLLGIDRDPHEQWANLTLDALAEQGRFAFLPPEKQSLLREIMAKYQQLESGTVMSGDVAAGDVNPKKLREQRRQELAQVLTPEELQELDLRDSNTADSVRSRFGSADLTEEEYRKLFALRRKYEEEQGASPDYSDPERMRRRSEARQQLEAAYKTALGDERAAEIQKQQDPSWRGLNRVAQQFGLPQRTLDQAYEYQRVAGEQLARLFSDPAVTGEARRETVRQIRDETERQLATLLGAQAFQQFKNSSPQFTFSSGGDTIAISGGPSIDVPIVAGPGERVTTTISDGVNARSRTVISAPK